MHRRGGLQPVKLEQHIGTALKRAGMPDWPRLMGVDMAADYLGVSATMLEEHGPEPKRWRGRRLYDRRDLDAFADGLGGMPLEGPAARDYSRTVEQDFLEARRRRKPGP